MVFLAAEPFCLQQVVVLFICNQRNWSLNLHQYFVYHTQLPDQLAVIHWAGGLEHWVDPQVFTLIWLCIFLSWQRNLRINPSGQKMQPDRQLLQWFDLKSSLVPWRSFAFSRSSLVLNLLPPAAPRRITQQVSSKAERPDCWRSAIAQIETARRGSLLQHTCKELKRWVMGKVGFCISRGFIQNTQFGEFDWGGF